MWLASPVGTAVRFSIGVLIPSGGLVWAIATFLLFPPNSLQTYPAFWVNCVAIICVSQLLTANRLWLRSKMRGRSVLILKVFCFTLLGFILFGACMLQCWALLVVGRDYSVRKVLQDGKSMRVQPSQIIIDETVAMEDHSFYQHRGLDLESMHRALRINIRQGHIRQGGSTITQQLAKNLFLTNDRTLFRKLLEIPLTFELERRLTKAQILDVYLHSIEYGMGQHGIDAASSYYFHTTANKLNLAQSAMLVGIVPHNPKVMPKPQTIAIWHNTALSRLQFFFSSKYSEQDISNAKSILVARIMYPYKASEDRGASADIPPGWQGVLWIPVDRTREPQTIESVSPKLKYRLGLFARDCRHKFGLCAILCSTAYTTSPAGDDSKDMAHQYGLAVDIVGFRFTDGSESYIDAGGRSVDVRQLELRRALAAYVDITVEHRDVNGHRFIHAEVSPDHPRLHS